MKKLYDKEKVFVGLAVFIVLMTFPFWYNMGKASPQPEVKLSDKARQAKECVAPKGLIRADHMQILNDWRTSVVRDKMKFYTTASAKKFNMSLSTGENSCIGCHVSKADFCDKCHNYASVRPYCWDCHIEPKENK